MQYTAKSEDKRCIKFELLDGSMKELVECICAKLSDFYKSEGISVMPPAYLPSFERLPLRRRNLYPITLVGENDSKIGTMPLTYFKRGDLQGLQRSIYEWINLSFNRKDTGVDYHDKGLHANLNESQRDSFFATLNDKV